MQEDALRGAAESRADVRATEEPPLPRVAALANALAADGIRRDAEALALRLAEGRFYVVCLGQLKRGKSTLLNALVGSSTLPTGVTPVTSVVTVLRYGERRAARVQTEGSRWRAIAPETLADYASEENNPGNDKRVTGIEVFEPAPLLRAGLCLVDTPGIGSVFAANTTATREFLPHVDAALIVVGGDPPVTADELDLVEDVSARVSHRLFVFAKSDRMSDAERAEAMAFTKRILAGRLKDRGSISILEVSASEVLTRGGPTRDWLRLVRALQDLAATAGADLVADAGKRGTANLTARLLATIDERIALLERPLAESEARLEALRSNIATAERALADLAPLLTAEETRLVARLEHDRDDFFTEAGPGADRELETALRFLSERGPALRRRALAEAAAVARRWLDEWRRTKAGDVDRLFRAANQRFVELLATIERGLAENIGHPGTRRELAADWAPGGPTHFYMTEMLAMAPTSFAATVADLIGARSGGRRRVIERDTRAYLRKLMDVNSARIKNDFRDGLATRRRTLENDVRRRLRDTIQSADSALGRARELREAGAARVAEELIRLRAALESARAIAVDHVSAGDVPAGPR